MATELPTPIPRLDVTHARLIESVVQGEEGRTMYEFGVMESGAFVTKETIRDTLSAQQVADITAIVLGGVGIPQSARDKAGNGR